MEGAVIKAFLSKLLQCSLSPWNQLNRCVLKKKKRKKLMPNFSKKKKTVKEALWAVACATRHQPTLQWQQMAQKIHLLASQIPQNLPINFLFKKNTKPQFPIRPLAPPPEPLAGDAPRRRRRIPSELTRSSSSSPSPEICLAPPTSEAATPRRFLFSAARYPLLVPSPPALGDRRQVGDHE